MNVRRVHGAIWREYPEPRELWRRTPAILRHFYVITTIGVLLYLLGWFPHWSWKSLDQAAPEKQNVPAAETPP
ncbi:MAG TPA: hypothetical protein VGG55_00790 [Candidatus Acidoferrales bacterium]